MRRLGEFAPLVLAGWLLAPGVALAADVPVHDAARIVPPKIEIPAVVPDPDDLRWKLGFYVGARSNLRFLEIVFLPWNADLQKDYIGAINLTYRVYRFKNLPMDLEIDGVVAKRFGESREWDFGILPMLRWRWFPWNHIIYTNLRFGPVGFSYTSAISIWEARTGENDIGSRYLNFMVPEITVSSGPDARWEAFVRIHHRSGAWGLINGVRGGSNYISTGLRVSF